MAKNTLVTDLADRRDAPSPVELLPSALADCVLTGIERVIPLIHSQIDGAEVRQKAIRREVPPEQAPIRSEIIADSCETDQRLDLPHRKVLKHGTIQNTLSGAVPREGSLRRGA